jgi:hypothetical protein
LKSTLGWSFWKLNRRVFGKNIFSIFRNVEISYLPVRKRLGSRGRRLEVWLRRGGCLQNGTFWRSSDTSWGSRREYSDESFKSYWQFVILHRPKALKSIQVFLANPLLSFSTSGVTDTLMRRSYFRSRSCDLKNSEPVLIQCSEGPDPDPLVTRMSRWYPNTTGAVTVWWGIGGTPGT